MGKLAIRLSDSTEPNIFRLQQKAEVFAEPAVPPRETQLREVIGDSSAGFNKMPEIAGLARPDSRA